MPHQVIGNIFSYRSLPGGLHRFLQQDLRVLVTIAAAVLFSAAQARADDQIRAVRLSNVVGSVQILSGAETQFSQAYPNMPLVQGSTLKTGEDGRAEVQFEDGSVARLTPNSSVALSVLGRTASGDTNTELDLLTGLSYVEMSGTANQRLVVHFNSDEVISPAPVKFRVNLDTNPVEFAVLDGSAHLSSGTTYAVDVRAGETVRFDAADAGRYFLAQGVDGDSWDQWNADRDSAMGQMAAQQTREARGSANPGDPGWNDLDYYGNWYSSPDGGSFWSPAGAGAGWDPYGSGYWGYYGNSGGYMWISGYPWGWLPFHCGNWNYYNTYGWGWVPGGCGTTWYPVAGIWNSPSGYRPVPRPIGRLPRTGPVGPAGPIRTLIAVDRGTEATILTPHAVAAPKTVMVDGKPVQLIAKTSNPANSFATRTTPTYGGRPAYTNLGGSMPVYRPSTPSTGYRPAAPTSLAGHSGGASGPGYSPAPAPSAPRMSAPSAPSAPSPSGGGHVK